MVTCVGWCARLRATRRRVQGLADGDGMPHHECVDSCCENKKEELEALRSRHGRTLRIVLLVNGVMFFIEGVAGVAAHSTALLADALDMFGDASIYALSLYGLSRGARFRAGAALAKGCLMAAFGLGVIVQATLKVLHETMPQAPVMGAVGALALAANGVCFWLLYRHRADDLNMRSTWLCSRNDIIANLGVLGASALVALLGAGWPDILVGLLIAGLFLQSALSVVREALAQLAATRPTQA